MIVSFQIAGAEVGDVILFSADIAKIVYDALGNLRLYLAEKLGLIPENEYALVWVVDFPLMEFDASGKFLRERRLGKAGPLAGPVSLDPTSGKGRPAAKPNKK